MHSKAPRPSHPVLDGHACHPLLAQHGKMSDIARGHRQITWGHVLGGPYTESPNWHTHHQRTAAPAQNPCLACAAHADSHLVCPCSHVLRASPPIHTPSASPRSLPVSELALRRGCFLPGCWRVARQPFASLPHLAGGGVAGAWSPTGRACAAPHVASHAPLVAHRTSLQVDCCPSRDCPPMHCDIRPCSPLLIV